MTPYQTRPRSLIRYSPRPIEAYAGGNGNKTWGPATSVMLNTAAAWNLAYLSHDFETSLLHADSNFTVRVRRTVQTDLNALILDVGDLLPTHRRFEYMFLLPAPRAVHLLMQHPKLKSLQMYHHYGEQWLRTIHERSFLCQADPVPPDNIVDFSQANAIINRVK